MKIAITGSATGIGAAAAKRLKAQGCEITAFHASPASGWPGGIDIALYGGLGAIMQADTLGLSSTGTSFRAAITRGQDVK